MFSASNPRLVRRGGFCSPRWHLLLGIAGLTFGGLGCVQPNDEFNDPSRTVSTTQGAGSDPAQAQPRTGAASTTSTAPVTDPPDQTSPDMTERTRTTSPKFVSGVE